MHDMHNLNSLSAFLTPTAPYLFLLLYLSKTLKFPALAADIDLKICTFNTWSTEKLVESLSIDIVEQMIFSLPSFSIHFWAK